MRLAIVTAMIAATSLLPAQEWNPAFDHGWDNGKGNFAGLFGKRPVGNEGHAPAVSNGLMWLTKNQQPDGRWHCKHSNDVSVAVTSLCVLAMLGDGNTMRRGPHKAPIKKAIVWLRKQQNEAGAFADATGAHLLATLAMTEAYQLSDFTLIKKNAVKGLNHAAMLRNPDGGWRASPDDQRSDPSLTVWGTTLLATAVEAKLAVPNDAFKGIMQLLRGARANLAPSGGVLGVAVPMIRQAELAHDQLAANAFTLCWLKLKHSDPTELATMRADAAILTKNALARARALPRIWEKNPKHKLSLNEWFLSSHALAQAGDTKGVEKITEALTKAQLTDGDNAGSWQPIGVWGKAGGRTWTTAMAVLTMEAPVRYATIIGR